MKDVANKEVQVGDTVAYCSVGYSGLQIGEVIKLTPGGVTVAQPAYPDGSGKGRTLNRQREQFCKVG